MGEGKIAGKIGVRPWRGIENGFLKKIEIIKLLFHGRIFSKDLLQRVLL